jgi:hypothetical protein
MRKIILASLVAFATLTLATAFAAGGNEVGNGGGVLICRDINGKIIKTELLDLYEARVMRNLQLGLGNPNEDYTLKVNRVLNQLEKISPIRAKKYKEMHNNFFSETAMVVDADLVFIPDAENLILPKGCKLEQIAIQNPPEFIGDNRYIINKEYWDLIDNNSKAALILHEIIYGEAIVFGHKNSKAVRYINSYLTSNKLEILNKEMIAAMYVSAKLYLVDLFGTLVFSEHLDYDFNKKHFSYLEIKDASLRPEKIYFSKYKDLIRPVLTDSGMPIDSITLADNYEINYNYETGKGSAVNISSYIYRGNEIFASSLPMAISFLEGKLFGVDGVSEFFSTEINLKNLLNKKNYKAICGNNKTHCLEFDLNNEYEGLVSFTGTISVADSAKQYSVLDIQSSPYSWIYEPSKNAFDYNGALISGYFGTNRHVETPQGLKYFIGQKSVPQTAVNFAEDGKLIFGMMAPNQKLILADGQVVKYDYPIIVSFSTKDSRAKVIKECKQTGINYCQ